MEDRSRRNIKNLGAAEAITTAEIVPYQHQFIRKIPTSITTQDKLIDRAHRIHKPQHLPASLPRDILARVHFFPASDHIMEGGKVHAHSSYTFLQNTQSLYNNISSVTSQACKSFALATAILMEHKITYKWEFPTKLLATIQNQQISPLCQGIPVSCLTTRGAHVRASPHRRAYLNAHACENAHARTGACIKYLGARRAIVDWSSAVPDLCQPCCLNPALLTWLFSDYIPAC